MTGHLEPIVGRYIRFEIEGVMHRIYFEENGSGIPLSVCIPRDRMVGSGVICSVTLS